jgi:malate dehydrogenase
VTTAAIIGAGDIGGAVAHALAARESVDRIVLIDDVEGAAAGKALDIQQACAITGAHTRLSGAREADRAVDADVLVIADRFGPASQEWSGEEGLRRIATLASLAPSAPLVFAGSTHAELMRQLAADTGVRTTRLIGASPEALASAVRSMVAMEAPCAPAEVMLSVLGAPPDGFVVAWSEASIGGHALERVLTPVQRTRLDARVQRLWPPRPYALGLAAATVVEGIVRTARRTFTVLSMLDGEFGARGRIGAMPVLVSEAGIVQRRMPSLSTRERVQLETALLASSR